MVWLACAILFFACPSSADNPGDIFLPQPNLQGGKPLMEVLKKRQSTRSFSSKALSDQMLSDLLWAAFGINRPESGKRTAPSARNWQEVDVYAVMEQNAYLYEPQTNILRLKAEGDLRSLTGTQDFVVQAPLNLVFVADTARMTGVSAHNLEMLAGADVGFISQNVYLFCASKELATVVRGSVDRDRLGHALGLPETSLIVLAQSVGYPEADAE